MNIDKPSLLLRRTRHGLEAVDQIGADQLEQIRIGEDVEVEVKKRRSSPQQRLYWKMLAKVVEATDCSASAVHLHKELKRHLGYVERRTAFDGSVYLAEDSTAFSKMDGAAFKVFFDKAVGALASELGIDPLEFYDQKEMA